MSGQAPWQSGRRAWQRLGGYQHPEGLQPVTDDNRESATTIIRRVWRTSDLSVACSTRPNSGAVRRARACGMGWTEIGALVSMSRQAAWERWHTDDEPSPDQTPTR